MHRIFRRFESMRIITVSALGILTIDKGLGRTNGIDGINKHKLAGNTECSERKDAEAWCSDAQS
jgi:hypothetical protein